MGVKELKCGAAKRWEHHCRRNINGSSPLVFFPDVVICPIGYVRELVVDVVSRKVHYKAYDHTDNKQHEEIEIVLMLHGTPLEGEH